MRRRSSALANQATNVPVGLDAAALEAARWKCRHRHCSSTCTMPACPPTPSMSRSLELRQHPAPSDRHTAQPTFEAEAATRERRAKRAGRDLGNDTAVSFPDVPLILL